MDDAALQEQFRRIKHRQYLILGLLVIAYLYGIADYIGFTIAGVLYAIVGVLGFGVIVAYRRQSRDPLKQ